jgi:hypothetical protein
LAAKARATWCPMLAPAPRMRMMGAEDAMSLLGKGLGWRMCQIWGLLEGGL